MSYNEGSMTAATLNWPLDDFDADEWPVGVLQHMNADVIKVQQDIRTLSGKAIYPSPVPEAHVRFSGNPLNRHYAVGRLSDATDSFVAWEDVWQVILAAEQHPSIGGLGIYTDMHYLNRSMAMIHIDLRAKRTKWVGWKDDKGELQYTYYNSDPLGYHRILTERGKINDK